MAKTEKNRIPEAEDQLAQETMEKEEKPIEEAFEELEQLAGRLEDPKTSLEDSFRFYKQGMELLKLCSDRLDTVEKKMLQLNEDGTLREFSRGTEKQSE